MALALPMLLLVILTGCSPGGSIVWSPDGTRAVYAVNTLQTESFLSSALLLDSDGKTVADLGMVMAPLAMLGGEGPVAWMANSRDFYYVAEGGNADPAFHADWAKADLKSTEPQPPSESTPKLPFVALYRWNSGKPQLLTALGKKYVVDLQLSGDGQWLTILTSKSDHSIELLAYHVADQRLFRVSNHCGYGICFTAINRIVYIEGPSDSKKTEHGELIDATLVNGIEAPKCTPIADVLLSSTGWLRAVPEGIVFISRKQSFPAAPGEVDPSTFLGSLYRWDRQSGELHELTQSVAEVSVSPDSKRMLYLTGQSDKHGRVSELALSIMNSDGTGSRKLGEAEQCHLALWPTWHGNNRFTRAAGAGTNIGNSAGGVRMVFDLVEVEVTGDSTTKPTQKKLSTGWSDQLKPYWFDQQQFRDIH